MKDSVRQLANNLGTIILSLSLAFIIWMAATLQEDPFATQEFSSIPISIVDQPENTILFNQSDLAQSVSVQVRAPESVLAEFKMSSLQATMALSQVQPGTAVVVPIEVTCSNETVRVEAWNPTEQTVQLETVQTITLPVTIEVLGQVATGYQATSPAVTPDQVMIHGPAILLDKVTSIAGSLDVADAREDIVETVIVRPLDADGELVAGLQWSPDRVEARAGIRRKLGYKPDVEVVPDLRGEPASGYRLGSVSVQPSTVTLAGLPAVLDELPGFMETLPISVTGATENLVKFSPLTAPNSVVVVGVDYVTVTVEVLPIQSSRAMTASMEIQGVRPGWIATPSPTVVDVIVEGPDTVLSALTPSDLRIVLDLFDYNLGVHRVSPQVLAPQGVSVVSIIPETIEVVIAPTPTPTPAAALTPTVSTKP